ncbi:hypothetical protein KDA_38710 [Dictyobacter alpinus]|uniref:G domain-containing protein n=1 Tax=Dictyobacter alpinus TaxID=2014873 RepID=A0A402BAS2_9CHLR|nr:GTPase domain-containing protein [Dictyobacter alpinus]GCE28387.1 hypothetical protein KDA_38710 [Dictyobacter alpinus]
MLGDPNVYDGLKILLAALGEAVTEKSLDEFERFLKKLHTKKSESAKPENEEARILSLALLKLQRGGTYPQIAVVGMVSAGKSTLVNTLFGLPIAETKITPDTTKGVLSVGYQSGLTIYDTPGIFGDDKYPYHNITRLFLSLSEDSDYPRPMAIPLQTVQYGHSQPSDVDQIALDNIKKYAPITNVLWVVNASRTLTGPEKKLLRTFFKELEAQYKGRLVVAGTHLDTLNDKPLDERKEMLQQWSEVSNGQLIPISSVTGEGLDQLVRVLFASLPDHTPLSKLQESLIGARKLNRLSFVLVEISRMLASIMLLDGTQIETIQVTLIEMFILICDHYGVDQDTWQRYSGDAIRIGREVQSIGANKARKLRDPKGFWERLRFVFGAKFFDTVTEFHALGVDGLKELLPMVYLTIYDFERSSQAAFSKEDIQKLVEVHVMPLIQDHDEGRLTIIINRLLISLFETL